MRVYSMYYVCIGYVTVYPGLQGEEQRIEQSPPDRQANAGSCHPAIFINTVHHRVQRAAIPRAQIIINAHNNNSSRPCANRPSRRRAENRASPTDRQADAGSCHPAISITYRGFKIFTKAHNSRLIQTGALTYLHDITHAALAIETKCMAMLQALVFIKPVSTTQCRLT